MGNLRQLLHTSPQVGTQETKSHLATRGRELRAKFAVGSWFGSGADEGSGGVGIYSLHNLLREATLKHTEVFRGCCQEVAVTRPGLTIDVLNTHNCVLSGEAVNRIHEHLQARTTEVEGDPVGKRIIEIGDFNYEAADSPMYLIHRVIERFKRKMIELTSDCDTLFNSSTKAMCRIGRVLGMAPRYCLLARGSTTAAKEPLETARELTIEQLTAFRTDTLCLWPEGPEQMRGPARPRGPRAAPPCRPPLPSPAQAARAVARG